MMVTSTECDNCIHNKVCCLKYEMHLVKSEVASKLDGEYTSHINDVEVQIRCLEFKEEPQ